MGPAGTPGEGVPVFPPGLTSLCRQRTVGVLKQTTAMTISGTEILSWLTSYKGEYAPKSAHGSEVRAHRVIFRFSLTFPSKLSVLYVFRV